MTRALLTSAVVAAVALSSCGSSNGDDGAIGEVAADTTVADTTVADTTVADTTVDSSNLDAWCLAWATPGPDVSQPVSNEDLQAIFEANQVRYEAMLDVAPTDIAETNQGVVDFGRELNAHLADNGWNPNAPRLEGSTAFEAAQRELERFGVDNCSAVEQTEQAAATAADDPTTPGPTSEPSPAPATTPEPEPATDDELSALVDVSIECNRGDHFSAAPFDARLIHFLESVPDDTAWTTQVVTITNGADVPVVVAPGVSVRYLDSDGTTLGEEDLAEPFPPAFSAAPGQTVHRNIVRFDVSGLPGPVRDPDLADRLFAELDSCEIVDDVEVSVDEPDQLIDADLAQDVEFVSCGLNDAGDRFQALLRVVDPGDEALSVRFAYEIVDREGNRLGIGGNDGDRLDASGQTLGWAHAFTVLDIDQATDCELLELSAE